uniref:Sulfhydryl oxidase n=1 Tax=Aceria tosichella TaxID=561515 RepID=A0A6G1S3Y6_9ACAR
MSGCWNARLFLEPDPIGFLRLALLCLLLLITSCQHQQSEASPTSSLSIQQQLTQAATINNKDANNQFNSSSSSSAASLNLVNSNGHLRLQYTNGGHIQIPGLYDDLDGFITPIQGQSQFNRLILGLDDADGGDSNLTVVQRHGEKCSTNLTDEQEAIRRAAREETISLVQFYMASCPDCQGFSPYFKRFSSDIAPHWRKLVRIYTVNCNDFQNIHLCQEQNPRLIVPLVRWYVFPSIQRDSLKRSSSAGSSQKASDKFNYPQELLNVAHRQFIYKQRRDLISLRQATLRFIALTLDELNNDSHKIKLRHHVQTRDSPITPKRLLYESLPPSWHHLAQLGREQPDDLEFKEQLLLDLNERLARCSREMLLLAANNKADCRSAGSGAANSTPPQQQQHQRTIVVRNFLVFEDRRSFIGRTLVADWSNATCRQFSVHQQKEQNMTQTIIVHRSSDFSQLTGTKILAKAQALNKPILVAFNVTIPASGPNNNSSNSSSGGYIRSIDDLDMKLLVWNETSALNSSSQLEDNHARHRRAAQRPRPERVQQRALLEEYYSRVNGGSKVIQPIRYAAAMSSIGNQNNRILHKRDTADKQQQQQKQAELENVNWVPESVHPGEERVRYAFNSKINQELANWAPGLPSTPPGSSLAGKNPGEIEKSKKESSNVVDPTSDDLALMFLTDYYRGLDEIVHIDMLSKGDVDGYQLLASCCFLRDLERHFPFQGNAHGSNEIGSKSIARHYIQLVQRAWLDELKTRLHSKGFDPTTAMGNGSTRSLPTTDSMLQRMHDKDGCIRLTESIISWQTGDHSTSKQSNNTNSTSTSSPVIANKTNGLDSIHVPSRELEQIQLKIKRQHEVGLPPERHIKWKYCAGSEPYLRGHTCSLWILFHTLTVHEYLALVGDQRLLTNTISNSSNRVGSISNDTNDLSMAEYQFQVDYAKSPRRSCDPNNPDGAYLASKTSELFLNETRFTLANIINFVRYYLPCTNCAAHFSCMVEHSTGLKFTNDHKQAWPDAHLLWLWEAHNRVNERTRGTHSEDPTRPKHIFPTYGACPHCYIEPPAPGSAFQSMRFNRGELVKFVVARYRKSAILNNQINIEDLYRKP